MLSGIYARHAPGRELCESPLPKAEAAPAPANFPDLDFRRPLEEPASRKASGGMPTVRAIHKMTGIDPAAIPTIGFDIAPASASEIGPDFSSLPSAQHFRSWLGLAPGTISAAPDAAPSSPARTSRPQPPRDAAGVGLPGLPDGGPQRGM